MTTYSVATNVTSATLAGTTTRTFSLTPVTVGNLVFMAVAWQATADTISSVTSSNATWSTIQAKVTGTAGTSWSFQFFVGVASSTSTQTVSIVFNVSPTAIQVDYMEFTADWMGKNPANWFFKVATPVFASSSTTVNWPSLTGFSNDEFLVGYGFMGGGLFTGTNGTPAGFVYNGNSTGNQNPFAWKLAYGVGPSIPTGTQAAAGTYLVFDAVFALYPSLVPATINAGSV